MAAAALTEGLSATDEARPVFTAPVLTEERVLRYRLTVTGRGAAAHGAVNRHRASATVQVTVRAGPALIGVAVTSEPQGYEIYGIEKTIEATASFGEAVEVKDGDPVLALDLGGVRRAAEFVRGSGTAELVFRYTVQEGDPEAGIGFPADPVLTPGGSGIRTVPEGMAEDMAVGLRLAATAAEHRMDGVRPELKEMEPPEVLGLTLKLIYHEALNEDSVPAAGAYAVTAKNRTGPANPTPLPVSAVGVKGNTVTLTLAAAPAGRQPDGDDDLRRVDVEPGAEPGRQQGRGAGREPGGEFGAHGVGRGGAPEGGAGPGRCGVPGDGCRRRRRRATGRPMGRDSPRRFRCR